MMQETDLNNLPKDTLIKLVQMYSRNWKTLDGLWFSHVEAACSLDTAVRIDLQNWVKQAVIEAKRIKEALALQSGGLASVLTVLKFMSWQLTSPLFKVEEESPTRIIFSYPRCAVQESREKSGKPVFPCKTMKTGLLSSIARVAEPQAEVRCLACPPDPRHPDYWCKWELRLDKPTLLKNV